MYSNNVITTSCIFPIRRFDTPVLTGVAGEEISKGNTLVAHWPPADTDNVIWLSKIPFYSKTPLSSQGPKDIYMGVALENAKFGQPIRMASTGMLVDTLVHVPTIFGGNPIPPGTLLTLTNEDEGEPVGLARFWDWPMNPGVLSVDYLKQIIGMTACAYNPDVVSPQLTSDLIPVVLTHFVVPWIVLL
jgi:hypothetical protein